jgi:hypothetical protein
MRHFLCVTYHSIVNKKKKSESNSFFGIFLRFFENELFRRIYENDQTYPMAISRIKDAIIKVKSILECPVFTI